MKKRAILIVSVLLAICLLFSGCGIDSINPQGTGPSQITSGTSSPDSFENNESSNISTPSDNKDNTNQNQSDSKPISLDKTEVQSITRFERGEALIYSNNNTTSNMWYVVGADNLIAEQFVANGPVVPVVCRFKTDSSTQSGLYWTSENAEDLIVSNGTFVSAKIVVDECAPITKLINGLKEKLEG